MSIMAPALAPMLLKEKSGEICVNGAAARLAVKGDIVIILTYCHVDDEEARNHLPISGSC